MVCDIASTHWELQLQSIDKRASSPEQKQCHLHAANAPVLPRAERGLIKGQLLARDLRRLEHLCGRALEQPKAPLTLRLTQASGDHPVVQAYLDQLVKRGAVAKRA